MNVNGSDLAHLVSAGVLTPQALEFLEACVASRLNVAVCGPQGCDKRMLLQSLAKSLITDGQILAVQNPHEPWLEHKSITPLRAQLPTEAGEPGISRVYLLSLVSKMHPTGLILDQVEGEEVVPLLQLILTMDGILFSVTADSPMGALLHLEEMARLHGAEARPGLIRKVLSSTIHLVIQLGRARSGSPTILRLTEVRQGEQDDYILCDIFVSADAEAAPDLAVEGHGALRATGARPLFLSRMEALGVCLSDDVFT